VPGPALGLSRQVLGPLQLLETVLAPLAIHVLKVLLLLARDARPALVAPATVPNDGCRLRLVRRDNGFDYKNCRCDKLLSYRSPPVEER
jgi:hypothetical protein